MLQRVRRFAIELHEDESGPNTVEWILLIIVALVILVAIYAFVKWVMGKIEEGKGKVEDPDIGL
ncbi:MAG: Flp family type IVb pilin [Planctomycetota bacterium]|jgi:Flp pilus assembly pilin Flp